ncbi:MAG: LuxR C-terminal-related transcriptional regulator [Actinomycetota bacterium]
MADTTRTTSTAALAVSPRLVLHGLRESLESAGFAIPVAISSGDDAIPTIPAIRPQLVVVSLRLPPRGGLHVIASLAQVRRDLHIVALVEPGRPEDGERALRAGALGWLDTDTEWTLCLDMLRAAAHGDAIGISVRRRRPLPGAEDRLTRRERQVLDLVLASYSVSDMASELIISPKTVKHHLSAIYAKFGVHSRAEAALAAVQWGLSEIDQASG